MISLDGINYKVINKPVKNERQLYEVLEKEVFISPYYTKTFYPVIVNGHPIFAYKNTQGYIHFYFNRKKYRFNSKNKMVATEMLLIGKEDIKRFFNEVRKDNKKL